MRIWPKSRLVEQQRQDRRLDRRRRPVLQDRLASRQLLQRQLAARLVEFLESVEAVARVAHHLAGLADNAPASPGADPQGRKNDPEGSWMLMLAAWKASLCN
jgi:hypothetical protein